MSLDLRRTLKWLFAVCGTVLFAYLLYHVGPQRVANSVQRIGWGIVPVVAIGGLVYVVRSIAWRLALGREYRRIPLWVVFRTYLAADSVGILFFGGAAVADATRVLLLGNGVPTTRAISSAILDRGLYIMGGAMTLLVTILLLPLVLHDRGNLSPYLYAIGAGYSLAMAAVWIAMRKRMRLISGVFRLAAKIRPLRRVSERRRADAARVEDNMFHFLDMERPAFWSACALNLLVHGFYVLEVFLLLWYLEVNKSPVVALTVEGLTEIANVAGAVIPGNVGTYEAGNMTILRLLGFQAQNGLILALLRDVRRIFWLGVGLSLFFLAGARPAVAAADLQRKENLKAS